MGRIRILIADDHAMFRDGLRALITAEPDMVVVAAAADGVEAVTLCRKELPDVALVDLSMPERDGLSAIADIHRHCRKTRVLALTMYDDPEHLRAVLAAGGAGYLGKQAAATELITAIREVHAGRAYIRLSLADDALVDVVKQAPDEGKGKARDASPLSRREHQVLALLVEGYTNKEIADRLRLKKKTVDTYRTRLQEKLEVKGRAALVRYALSHDVVRREP